jgi:hypothetical protein
VGLEHSTDMERRLVREAHLEEEIASIISSMSTAKFVRATWSLDFSAWIIWILYALV